MTLRRVGPWFLVVGAAAALVHLVAFALVRDRLPPELANVAGFLAGFSLSFAGHRWLSFSDTAVPFFQSLRRFGMTAGAGFLTNELVFVLMLRGLGWADFWALLLALLVAAGQTFVLSRYWAFSRQ